MIFLGLKFWPQLKGFFWSMKDAKIFWVEKKKQREFLDGKKSTKGFFWV